MGSTPGNKPTVSVVIGSYNAALWIGETLESLLRQTFGVLEVIVTDDGSTDGTPDVVASYGDRVRLLRESHRGRPWRNRGIQESRGDYVAFVDADDVWDTRKLEVQLDVLHRTGRRWSICRADWLDDATGVISEPDPEPIPDGDILVALFKKNFIVASTVVVARNVLEKIGDFDESPGVAAVEDWDLWLRIAAHYPVASVNRALATLRLHAGSFLAGLPLDERLRHMEVVMGRAVARNPELLRAVHRQARANSYFSAGVQTFRTGRTHAAGRYFARAWRLQPMRVGAIVYLGLTLLPPQQALFLARLWRRLLAGVR